MPRCLSEGVDIFLKSAERQGGANRTFATGGRCHGWQLEPCPYGLEPLYHFSIEISHLETQYQGVMFRSLRAFVRSMATLRYESCTQFINMSQKVLHIYWQFSAMSHAIHKIVSIPPQACAAPLPPALWSGSGCRGSPVLRRPRRSSRYHLGIRSLLPSIHNVSKAIGRSPVPA